MASAGPLVIGRYSLQEPIASGGMATVYFGRQKGDLGFSRLVAIKRLHPHFANEHDFVAMFLDEARLAARVRHPNVVETLDVVREGDETFIVLEYVDGESLAGLSLALRKSGERMPLDVAVGIVSGLCRGIHAAHEARGPDGAPLGIVHRDVSPQNVLVGADGVARVVDFGVALANVRLSQTRTGQVKGKPAYMAPEQLANDEVTRSSDIYAAGVVLWELCAGRRAYDAANEGALYVRVMTGSIPKLIDVAPWVPSALADAVQRALSRDRTQRFPSAKEMADSIERALAAASPAAIGALVERWAAEPLRARREIAARLERAAAPDVVAISAPREEAEPPAPFSAPAASVRAGIATPARSERTHTVTAAPMAPRARARPWLAIGAAIVAACGAGVAGTWLLLRGAPGAAPGPEGSAIATESAGASGTAIPVDTAESENAGADEASPEPSAPAEPAPASRRTGQRGRAAPRSPAASETTKTPHAAAAPSPTASAARPCEPPWFIDADGIRRVKRQCF